MDSIRLYGKFLAIHIKSAMAYKASFFFTCIGHMLLSLNAFWGVTFMLGRFGSIGGYSLPVLALCYGVIIMSASMAECFGRGFDMFARVLSQAQFDRILVRPRGLMFQVLCQDMKPANFSRILQGAAMLAYGIHASAVDWTIGKVLTLAAMVLCGGLVFFGFFVINAALCFFTLEGLEVINILTNGTVEYGKYPFSIYGKGVLWVLTLLVPLALVQYWPLEYLLNRGPWWYGLLPLAALLFLLPCGWLWRYGVRHYRSTGS